MDLTPYLERLREDLSTTVAAADEQTRRSAATLAAALEPAARLTLMNALADLAAEVTANLPDHVVDVRLDGRDVRVVVTGGESGPAPDDAPPPPPPPPADPGDISRITLRLFDQLKSQAEQAAAAQGMSLNAFVQQAVQGALEGKHQHWHAYGKKHGRGGGRSHLHGWVKG